MVHLFDQHFALGNGGIQSRLLGLALFADVRGHQEQLINGLAFFVQGQVVDIPDLGGHFAGHDVLTVYGLSAVQAGQHVSAQHPRTVGVKQLFRRLAQGLAGIHVQEGGGSLVAFQHLQALGIHQGDGHGRHLDDALQGGLSFNGLGLGLAAAVNVQQSVGDVALVEFAVGDHGVAHHPEHPAVSAHHLTLECVSLTVLQVVQVVGHPEGVIDVRGGHGAQGLPDEVGQVARKHAARGSVHPGDALAVERDDADKDGVQNGASSVSLQGQVLFGSVAVVHVDERGDEAFFRAMGVDQTQGHFGPQSGATAVAQGALTLPVAQAAQDAHHVGL